MIVSVVHVAKGAAISGPCVLERHDRADQLLHTSFMREGTMILSAIATNEEKFHQGAIVLGMGFTFDDTDNKGVASSLAN